VTLGRETLDDMYAELFGAEQALVQPRGKSMVS